MQSSTVELHRYRVYCVSEGMLVDGYRNRDDGPPTTCFHDHTHTIDPSQTELIEAIYNNHTPCVRKWKMTCVDESQDVYNYLPVEITTPMCPNDINHAVTNGEVVEVIHNDLVTVRETYTPMPGFIRIESVNFEIPPLETVVFDLIKPFPVSPLTVTVLADSSNRDDILTIDVSPNKIIGAIGAPVSVGTTTVYVTPTVLKYGARGFPVCLTDGVQMADMGFITEIDYKNSAILCEKGSTSDFSPFSPTYVKITARYIGPHVISGQGKLVMGASKIGASYIPKGEIVRISYQNLSPNKAKTLNALIEYIY